MDDCGTDPRAVTRRFTWLTGRPALMPRWTLGYSGSTMSYTDAPDAAAQLAGFLNKLAEHDIGCTSFHLSSGYTSIGDKRYVFHWNREKFPDPQAFVATFAAAGVELVPNIKPALLRSHPRFDEVASAGFFVADAAGVAVEAQFWDEAGSYIDFTQPRAAEWWREQVERRLTRGSSRRGTTTMNMRSGISAPDSQASASPGLRQRCAQCSRC